MLAVSILRNISAQVKNDLRKRLSNPKGRVAPVPVCRFGYPVRFFSSTGAGRASEGGGTMKRVVARSRSLLLVVALTALAAVSSVPVAHAASTTAEIGAVASRAKAVSDSPCSFIPAQTCQSTNPAVTLNIDYTGDTSACTFTWGVEWGDGATSPNIVVTDPPDGYVLLAQHTYATPGTYSITVLAGVPDGSCTENDFAVQFTYLPTPTPGPAAPSALPLAAQPVLVRVCRMRQGFHQCLCDMDGPGRPRGWK
jgi:hypothetical protein